MTQPDVIRIGIVGAGANTTNRHIPGFQAIEGVEIVSVCNRTKHSSQRVAGKFGISTIYDSWQELVRARDTNAIMIGTWPYLHHPITMAALSEGKHVLCEARMAMNASQAREMLAASQANPSLVTQIVPSPFSLKVDRTIQRMIAAGYLGQVIAADIFDQSGFLDDDGIMHWRHDTDLSGVNTLSLGIWYEALMRWIGTAKRVTAMGQTIVKMRRDPETGLKRSVHIPEHLDVIAEMDCGAQLHIGISRATGFGIASQATLYGSKGTLQFKNNQLFGAQLGDPELQVIDIPESEAGGWRVEEEFIAAIRGAEEISHTTFQDGVKYMEFTEAVVKSMAEGKAISLRP